MTTNRRLDFVKNSLTPIVDHSSYIRKDLDLGRKIWLIFSFENGDGSDNLRFQTTDGMLLDEILEEIKKPGYKGYMRGYPIAYKTLV